jgi:biotin transport system substrate-specific component
MQNSAQAVAVRPLPVVQKAALVVGASLFVALCARISVPLPFTPVPLTMANFGVLLVGLALGSRGGFAALALYLAEGAMGMPVFSGGAAGALWLTGATGGYLMAYPFAACAAGWIAERGGRSFLRFTIASLTAEIVVFAGGVGWLMLWVHGSVAEAAQFALYPFVFAEIAGFRV